MTTTHDPTTTPEVPSPLADRMKAADVDDRWRELPDEIQHAALTEETIEKACAWLEAHPRVPAWLNLDGYCPPELRARIATAREHIAEAMPALTALGKELAEVQLDVWAHIDALHIDLDDHPEVLDPWTGVQSLYDEAIVAADQIAYAFDGIRNQGPEWYIQMRADRLVGSPVTVEEVQS